MEPISDPYQPCQPMLLSILHLVLWGSPSRDCMTPVFRRVPVSARISGKFLIIFTESA